MPPSPDGTSWVTLRILGIGNLLGAVVSFFYFRFVDSSASELPGVGSREIGFSVVAFAMLIFIGYRFSRRWAAPLTRWSGPDGVADATVAMVRRRALLFPYVLAGVSVVGWLMAGVLWGVVWPFLAGTLAPHRVARAFFGNTVFAGGV